MESYCLVLAIICCELEFASELAEPLLIDLLCGTAAVDCLFAAICEVF